MLKQREESYDEKISRSVLYTGMGVFMMVLLGACQHKDLFFDDHYQLVDVNIHWEDGVIPPPKGMRVEFYTLHDMSTEIGTEDFASSSEVN